MYPTDSARPELTVREHVRIFSDLKCLEAVNNEVVNDLVKGVDLVGKLPAKAKTLSGGQKRKLQLAMMFELVPIALPRALEMATI